MTEIEQLERELATEAAVSDVETCCLREESGSVIWYDLESAKDDDKDWLARAVRYLDMRGLLERMPGSRGQWARIIQ